MKKTIVKVCGITRPDQAVIIEKMGVDLIGLNFVKQSPRFISEKNTEHIVKTVSSSKLVGVFMNQKISEVNDIIRNFGLEWAQLHGQESQEYCSQIKAKVIKVFSFEDQFDPKVLKKYQPKYFLFDAKKGKQLGGTGHSFNWNTIQCKNDFFLAGGLGPANLEIALRESSPFGVDLNSKIEDSPGVKNLAQLEQCLQIVKRFDKSSFY